MALPWFERNLKFGYTPDMLPFFLERLQGTIIRLEEKIRGIDEKILSRKLEGKWSIKENIGHLAEVDEVSNKRLTEMTLGVAVLSPAVFEPQDYNPWPAGKILDLFKKNRLHNLKKYKTLSGEQLKMSSLHP